MLEERLGEDNIHLVTRYLVKLSVRRNYMPILHAARESLRFQVPPAATAAVLTGFLRDLIDAGHLSPDLAYLAVDPSKIRRAREAVNNFLKSKQTTFSECDDVYKMDSVVQRAFKFGKERMHR